MRRAAFAPNGPNHLGLWVNQADIVDHGPPVFFADIAGLEQASAYSCNPYG